MPNSMFNGECMGQQPGPPAASRFSVLYAVPVEAFPVVWERPQELGVHGESW